MRKSAKNVAVQIALKTKEKEKLSKELVERENNVELLQAREEVHRQNRDRLHQERKEIQGGKQSLYEKSNDLQTRRKLIKSDMYDGNRDWDKSQEDLKIINNEIDAVMSEIKEINVGIDDKIQQAQIEHERWVEVKDELYKKRNMIERERERYNRSSVALENEIRALRRKMKDIQDKMD